MVRLQDIPLVMPIAEWVWGSSSSKEDVSPEFCLDHFGLTSSCFSQLLAKALGVAIILGACINKTPIMLNMWKSKSAAGFSRMSIYAETMVFANGAAYGILQAHPLTAYGENVSLFVQNLVLIALVWQYSKTRPSEMLQFTAAAFLYLILVGGFLPEEKRVLLQTSNGVILLYSRGTQVWDTYQAKHTGAQSIITSTLNLAGGLARIFTTLNETGDMAVVMGFLLSVTLNIAIFVQYWIYKANTQTFLEQLEAERTAEGKKKKQ